MMKKAYLVLEDGEVFEGKGLGKIGTMVGELVFNTSMTGYQEILTDPSYAGQILIMAYPLIGNYGISKDRFFESEKVWVSGFVVREACEKPNHMHYDYTLDEFLYINSKQGISDVDTRKLVKKIRTHGVMSAVICVFEENDLPDINKLINMAKNNKYSEYNFVELVGSKKIKEYRAEKPIGKRVGLIDCGVKMGIIRELNKRGVDVVSLPYSIDFEKIMSYNFDGIVLSNGPGDPKVLKELVKTTEKIIENNIPLFGICLGHQIIGHALGGDTFKLKFGHRGANHPVIRNDGKAFITTQNHGYAVVKKNIPHDVQIIFKSLNDDTIEGIKHKTKNILSVQFHPEANPGPHDTRYLFDDFIKRM